MKTTSTGMSVIGVPGTNPMYSRARRASSRLAKGTSSGSGIRPVTSTVIAGLVPHVTWGAIVEASIARWRSKAPGSSVRRVFQSASAASRALPLGANGRSPVVM
jgi:hypothetical protein